MNKIKDTIELVKSVTDKPVIDERARFGTVGDYIVGFKFRPDDEHPYRCMLLEHDTNVSVNVTVSKDQYMGAIFGGNECLTMMNYLIDIMIDEYNVTPPLHSGVPPTMVGYYNENDYDVYIEYSMTMTPDEMGLTIIDGNDVNKLTYPELADGKYRTVEEMVNEVRGRTYVSN